MVFILVLFVLALIAVFIAFLMLSRRRFFVLQREIALAERQLKQANESEQALRQELKKLEHQLSHAIEDPITALPGWELFEDRLNQSIRESIRYQLIQAVLFIDIDDFKRINNALGYKIGDLLLMDVAKRLQTCIRQVDSIARLTKDIFVCLLTQLTKPETAAIVAQRMLNALTQPFQIKEHELYIYAGIGIAICPSDGQDVATLLRHGEYALHLAKEKGKQSYQFYHEKTHQNSQWELLLSTSLNNQSALHEFVLYYQPILNTESETIVCMDALLHWNHPTLGLIKPQVLFDFAEKQHKLNILTEWSLQHACQQFLTWRSLGFTPDWLGITISLQQLESSQFVYRISQILQELKFNPEWLLLEIKVRQVQVSLDVLEKAFNMLKYLGIKTAIDNFGTSPFLLLYLKKIQVDCLKLDPLIIDDIDANQRTVDLVKSFAFFASHIPVQLIVQGVESSKQSRLLTELGCHFMQGYFLSPPLSEKEVTSKMVERLP